MNAPKRHARGHGTLHTNTVPAKSTGEKAGSVKIGASQPLFDNYGEPLRKKTWGTNKPRKTWGA